MSEVSPEILSKTQKSLGKYVKKPALSEKLLKKPPFRFLHDVVKAVIKETGFLNGLFSDDELNFENVKEKEAKMAFLTKLIDAVKAVSKTDLKVRPSKIVAGLEPTETNVLLQTIAKSIDRKIDTKDYVAKIKSGQRVIAEKNNKIKKDKDKKESARKTSKTRESSVTRTKKPTSVETPKSTDRSNTKNKSPKVSDKNQNSASRHNKGSDNKAVDKKITKTTDEEQSRDENKPALETHDDLNNATIAPIAKEISNTENIDQQDVNEADAVISKPDENVMANFSNARQGSAGLVRPKSARPKSGDRVASSRGRAELLDTNNTGVVEMKVPANPSPAPVARPSSSLRPPSVRPSSARPGAPRLRPESALPISEPIAMGNINVIVENFDSGLGDDEDTVVIQNAPEVTEDDASDLLNISSENKGQLVEQILEQIQEGQEDGVRKKVEIDWEQDGLRGKDATTKKVTQLRSLIQSLTKTANPLGKLMNYLHEDLDTMHNELQMWTNTKKQLYMDIEKQKKLAVDSDKPLLDKLDQLRQEIKKKEQEILGVRSNILRNEQRIAELLGNK